MGPCPCLLGMQVDMVALLDLMNVVLPTSTHVYVNGIPANDPGASWYDFGHDFASGQTVKVITGANGVIYGPRQYGRNSINTRYH